MFKKIIAISLLLFVGFMVISSASAIFGSGEGNLVDVTGVGIYGDYSGGSFGGAVDSSIASRQDQADLGGDNSFDMELMDYNRKMVNSSSVSKYDIKLGMLINITAKETMNNINKFKLSNVEVTYKDGSVQKIKNVTYSAGGDLIKNEKASLPFEYKLNQSLWNESIKLKDFYGNAHVKGDIYIKTDNGEDKLIGHIDNDVTASA